MLGTNTYCENENKNVETQSKEQFMEMAVSKDEKNKIVFFVDEKTKKRLNALAGIKEFKTKKERQDYFAEIFAEKVKEEFEKVLNEI